MSIGNLFQNGNEPAFPSPAERTSQSYVSGSYGMSKRFYAAVHALPAVISAVYSGQVSHKTAGLSEQMIAEQCFALADALLEQEEAGE